MVYIYIILDNRERLKNKRRIKTPNILTKNQEEEDKKKKTKNNEEKKKGPKNESSVKYEFKKPEDDLLKIIPFCNNIFTIQKNES